MYSVITKKLRADIHRDLSPRRGPVIVYTDSKGYNVGRHVRHTNPLEDDIVWRCQEGMRTEVGVAWLNDELEELWTGYGNVHVYFWCGTCDLTFKSGRFIYLSSTYQRDCQRLIRQLHLLANCAYRKGLPLTLLEIPIFSITEFNTTAGRKFPYCFYDQDKKFVREIEKINVVIREINDTNYKVSPQISLDLQRHTSNVRIGRQRQYYYNYKLYRDGIHPRPLLRRLWLRKLSLIVKKGCL